MILVFIMAFLAIGPTDARLKGKCTCDWFTCTEPVCASNHMTFDCLCRLKCWNVDHNTKLFKLYDGECYADLY
ncbi:Kazal peptide Pr13a-like [Leguminivora glycinivorella]|uniref:Kazal peptide Pr13a-like n=1 Tax=Leguminivora glycinivorella TaxID=1035111 RepID=UPI00200F8408|nr:Kazal peptide Pr13a-like [Leguminivora glycinivorella]